MPELPVPRLPAEVQAPSPLRDLPGPEACMAVECKEKDHQEDVLKTQIRNVWLVGAKTSG